ncbi:MAG: AAA family ATPase, partial [Bacteroidota bacterium]|nr:AAA family ATPase [Bacteroidota bacterium]
MILKDVKISKYKSYSAEHIVNINEKITTLVGKNESGKTAFLEAIAKSNYFQDDPNFKLDTTIDFPRKELAKYKKKSTKEYCVICTYKISTEVLEIINSDLGLNVFNIEEFQYQLNYDTDNTIIGVTADEAMYLSNLYETFEVADNEKEELSDIKTISELMEYTCTNSLETEPYKFPEIQNHIKTKIFSNYIESWDDPLRSHIYKKYLQPNIPKFWYYDEYYKLPSRININNLSS